MFHQTKTRKKKVAHEENVLTRMFLPKTPSLGDLSRRSETPVANSAGTGPETSTEVFPVGVIDPLAVSEAARAAEAVIFMAQHPQDWTNPDAPSLPSSESAKTISRASLSPIQLVCVPVPSGREPIPSQSTSGGGEHNEENQTPKIAENVLPSISTLSNERRETDWGRIGAHNGASTSWSRMLAEDSVSRVDHIWAASRNRSISGLPHPALGQNLAQSCPSGHKVDTREPMKTPSNDNVLSGIALFADRSSDSELSRVRTHGVRASSGMFPNVPATENRALLLPPLPPPLPPPILLPPVVEGFPHFDPQSVSMGKIEAATTSTSLSRDFLPPSTGTSVRSIDSQPNSTLARNPDHKFATEAILKSKSKSKSKPKSKRKPSKFPSRTTNEACQKQRWKRWTKEEDSMLRSAVAAASQKPPNWRLISSQYFSGTRSHVQVRGRWNKHLSPDIKTGKFTEAEDDMIRKCMSEGMDWASIAKEVPGRLTEHVKERWINSLQPDLKRGLWTEEEGE